MGCYALDWGSHQVTGYMPAWFEGPPYNARVYYYVWAQQDAGTLGKIPGVNITVLWSEP